MFERILKIAKDKGFKNIPELAIFMGYDSAEKLYRLKRLPDAKPSIDIVIDFTNKFEDLNVRWFLTGVGEPFFTSNITPKYTPNDFKTDQNILQLVPRVITVDKENHELIALVPHKASAGYLRGYADPEYIESLPALSLPGFKGLSHRAFEVWGQSMMPTHHSGSIAIGRAIESFNDIRDRRVYIIVTKTDGIVLKRVLNRIKDDGKLILISDNDNKKEYPNYPLCVDDILEMWYWRGSLIRESPEPGGVYHRINDLEARLTLMQNNINQLSAGNKPFIKGA